MDTEMDRKSHKNLEILEDRNLGFLSLSNFGVHGASTKNNYKSSAANTVNDKLKYERAKANEVMMKMNCKVKDTSVKQNESFDSPDLNYTDYEPYRIPKSINLSDLVTENTIRISSSIPSDTKTSTISFEPSEITGRSTHIHTDNQKQRKSKFVPSERLSVADILSSSFAPKVRSLRDSISSTSSINTHSLPRTADMSKNFSSDAQDSFHAAIANSFGENLDSNCSAFDSEDFAPCELMESKLISDEISWAEKHAAIPAAILSKDAKEKAKVDWRMNSDFRDSMSGSNSSLAGDTNFSFGQFFNERVENLSSILPNKYPDKYQNPRPLIHDISITKNEANTTYDKYQINFEKIEKRNTKKHESKDSGTASDNSCVLSLSAIDRALANLDLQSEDSPDGAVKKFFDRAKKQISPTACAKPVATEGQNLNHLNKFQQNVDNTLENKENLDPNTGAVSSPLSDTLSFTDSILNSSDLRKENSSFNKSRSPLSPLEIAAPKIHVAELWDETTNGADVDEWSSPTTNSNNRRVVRKKSPKDKGINNPYRAFVAPNESSPEATTPTNRSLRINSLKVNKNTAMISEKPSGSQRSVDSPISSPGRGVSPLASSPFQDSPHRSTTPNRAVLPNPTEKLEVLRSTSPYSSCSEFSHRDGKLIPIKVTAFSLSWCSVKLRSVVHKSIQVKNTSNKRLVLRAEVNGPGFQILNTQNSSNITLHSQECRTITISFCPTVTGVAVGDLSLSSPHSLISNNAPYLRIPLYAFGGHASVKIFEALRAPDNSLFLSMGNVNELPRPLEQTFKLYNKGPMIGFAKIFADRSSLNLQRDDDSFIIKPNHVLIMPDSAVIISVVFKPKREYLRKIIKKAMKVQVLGNLRIFCGDEVHRQRLRRIIRNNPSDKSEEIHGLITNNDINGLWNVFPNEIELSELEALNDDVENVNEFMSCISLRELALTLNFDELNDTTISSTFSFHNNIDETVIFRTPNRTRSPNPVDEDLIDKSVCSEDEDAVSSTREISWSVQPNVINIDMNGERQKDNVSFSIINYYKSRQYFEISCNVRNVLIFTPSEGYVEPEGGNTKINVFLVNKELLARNAVMINVYIENERISLPVKFS